MSKNIAISDEVYERLAREKGDRSFSEVIEELLETNTELADVHGAGILDEATYEAVKADVADLSRGTADRLDDEAR